MLLQPLMHLLLSMVHSYSSNRRCTSSDWLSVDAVYEDEQWRTAQRGSRSIETQAQ